jgi:hypothetical protein
VALEGLKMFFVHKPRKQCGSKLLTTPLSIILAAIWVSAANAEIIWSGDYETGNFMQWHKPDTKDVAAFFAMPAATRYGAPIEQNLLPGQSYQHQGDGSWASVVTSPVRNGSYAGRFTVKNSVNGSEPEDCDVKDVCHRRRTELTAQTMLPDFYNGLPYMSERWMSVSIFLPEDWDSQNGTGWGPHVFQVKPRNESGLSPIIAIEVRPSGWRIWHRWSDVENPSRENIPWQQAMYYDSEYPALDGSDSGADLRADFPDQQSAQAALANLNKGGWTDWIFHIRFDARGASDGGQGFLTVWKRADDQEWIRIVKIEPRVISRGDLTFDRGIGYNSPPMGDNNGGFGIKAGLYMEKTQVWDLPANRVVYNDNIKVGDASTSFSEMSPDGSSPGTSPAVEPPPKAPPLEVN